jgi:hypothetical protein
VSKWFNFDARGNQSKTLMFVSVSWLVVVIKFVIAGVNLGQFGIMPPMSAGEFGTAIALILAIWLGREWQEKTKL